MRQENKIRKLLSLYLVFALMLITLPAQAWAMFIPAVPENAGRQSDLHVIQKTLESSIIKERLMEYGLSSEEALARINAMSDQQVHDVASRLDSLQAGADGAGTLIFLLLVAIIVVVVLEVTGHHVIVR